jgi:hypothetical protein
MQARLLKPRRVSLYRLDMIVKSLNPKLVERVTLSTTEVKAETKAIIGVSVYLVSDHFSSVESYIAVGCDTPIYSPESVE